MHAEAVITGWSTTFYWTCKKCGREHRTRLVTKVATPMCKGCKQTVILPVIGRPIMKGEKL